jgi:biotin synthase
MTQLHEDTASPGAVRLSLAAAMTLGLEPGRFYRDARLRCINLLETYPEGCAGKCAYCGLARDRGGPQSFIRVRWPTWDVATVIERMAQRRSAFDRVCLSMITHRGALDHVVEMAGRIRARLDVPISALVTPTLVDRVGLEAIREAGVDRIGIAVDAATPELFDRLRGRAGGGPHRWERYWDGLAEGAEVFGRFKAGCHLIVGLGETEREMVGAFGRARSVGCVTHLFSFFPEVGSAFGDRPQPPVGQYRRMQVARFLIDGGLAATADMEFDGDGRLVSFGVPADRLEEVLSTGEPFRTSGCPGPDGEVACNRPFANSRPGPDLRNYPFPLDPDDLAKVRRELWGA